MLIFDDFYNIDIVLPADMLLLNIETTGLSPRNAFIFMIGMGWPEGGRWHFRCLLAESRMDERKIMTAFYEQMKNFNQVLTYGGQSFSWRFMENRWTNYSDTEDHLFADKQLLDLQKDISPYRVFFPLPDLKKSTIETFTGFNRRDNLSGKELIAVFSEWERSHDEHGSEVLLKHHREDMLSLLQLHTLTAYTCFWKGDFEQILSCKLENDVCRFHVQLKSPVPHPLQYQTQYADIALEGTSAVIAAAIYHGRLKYFLPGPVKDYFYLPYEDQAMHRSVACYVDKDHRQKATAATCYTWHEGYFLPTNDKSLHPRFQADYQSKPYYISCDTANWEKNPALLKNYLASCII